MKILFFLILLFPAIVSAQKRPLTIDDLLAMKRTGSFDLSPDGNQIVFDLTTYNMDENKGNSDIYTGVNDSRRSHDGEYHFVVKPQDTRFWLNSIFEWFEKYNK